MRAQGNVAQGTAGLADSPGPDSGPDRDRALVDPAATRAASGYPGTLRPGGAGAAEHAIAHVDAPGRPAPGRSGTAGGRSRWGRAGARAAAGRKAGAADEPAGRVRAAAPAGKAGPGGRGRAGRAQASVWQEAWAFWQEAGIGWALPAQVTPVRPEHDRTEPIPVIRGVAPPSAMAQADPGAAGDGPVRDTTTAAAAPGAKVPGSMVPGAMAPDGTPGTAAPGTAASGDRAPRAAFPDVTASGGAGAWAVPAARPAPDEADLRSAAGSDTGAVTAPGAGRQAGEQAWQPGKQQAAAKPDAAAPAAGEAGGQGEAAEQGGPGGQGRQPGKPAGRPTGGKAGGQPPGPAAGGRPGRGRSRRVVVSAGVAVAVLAAGGVYLWKFAGTGTPSLGPVAGLPAAVLAGADFHARPGAPGAGTGAVPALAGLAGSGADLVAFGSQPGVPAAKPLFLFSPDGGRDWRAAGLSGGSGASPAGGTPVMAAGGPGRWLALGPDAAWVSANGLSWTEVPGIAPLAAGDRVLALTWTGSGFVAVGEHDSGTGATPAPVMWTSADGLTWQRRSGLALRLPAVGRAGALRWAASRGRTLIVGGDVARTTARRRGGRKAAAVSYLPGAWRSTDGGARWTPVAVPTTHGASQWLGGVAAGGRFFLAVRPGRTAGGKPDAVAFASANGRTWRFAGKLAGGALRLGGVSGGDGAVVTGSVGSREVGFVTVDGRHWQRPVRLGEASAALSGVTVGPGGAVVAAGAAPVPGSAGAGVGSTPFLLLAGAQTANVGQRQLAAAARSVAVVRDLAAGGGREVAVGSADGAPAIWARSPGGRWSPADSGPAAPGAPGLTGVAHGSAGWLAVGASPAATGAGATWPGSAGSVGAAQPVAGPVVLTSGNGSSWQAAPGAGPLTGPGAGPVAVAAGRSGYVVVGQEASQGQSTAAAWWSANLTGWAPAAGWPGGAGGQPSQALAVAAGRSGFAAAGAIGAAPAVWVSPDGRRWTASALPLPPGRSHAELTQVAIVGKRIVAVGMAASATGAGQAPFAAVSLDGGRTWRESLLATSGAPATVTALTATPGGFVAAGARGAAGHQHTVFWWSLSGRGWVAVPLAGQPGARQVAALRVLGASLAGVGYEATPTGDQPVLWLAPLR